MAYTPSISDIEGIQSSEHSTAVNASAGYTPSLSDIPEPTAQAQQQIPQSQVSQDPSSQSNPANSIKSYATAGVAGLANSGADIGEATASALTYLPSKLMQHLGIISPETASNISKAITKGADQFRSTQNVDSEDPFNKASGEHPILSEGLRAGVDILAGSKALGASGQLGTAIGGNSVVGGIAARAATMGVVGQAMDSNPDTKTTGFLLNAVLSPVYDGAGKLITTIGTKTGVVDSLKNLVNSANEKLGGLTTDERMGGAISNFYSASKSVVNKWYDVVKGTEFTPQDQASTYSLGRKINDFLYTNGDKLAQNQKNVLADSVEALASAGSHADTLDALQSLNSKFNQFSGLNASDSIFNFYKDTQTELRNVITRAAEREGNGAAMNRANLIHERMIVPAQEIGADDITNAVQKFGMGSDEVKQVTNNIISKYVDTKGVGKITQLLNAADGTSSNIISQHIVKSLFDTIGQDANFSYSKASEKLGAYITKYDGVLSKPAIESLKGAQNIMKESELALQRSTINSTTAHIVGGAAGGAIGYKASGGTEGGAIAGSIAGAIGAPIVLKYAKYLMSTPQGQDILRGLNAPGDKMKAAGNLIKAMGTMGVSHMVGSGQEQQ